MKHWIIAICFILMGVFLLMKGISGLTMSAHQPRLNDAMLFPQEVILSTGHEAANLDLLSKEQLDVRRHYKAKLDSASDAFFTLALVGAAHFAVGLLIALNRIVMGFIGDWKHMNDKKLAEQVAASDR